MGGGGQGPHLHEQESDGCKSFQKLPLTTLGTGLFSTVLYKLPQPEEGGPQTSTPAALARRLSLAQRELALSLAQREICAATRLGNLEKRHFSPNRVPAARQASTTSELGEATEASE